MCKFTWCRTSSMGETQNRCSLPICPWCLSLGFWKMCLWGSKSAFPLPGERALATLLHGARVLPAGLPTEQEGARENFATICCVWWFIPGGRWLAFWSDQVRRMQTHLLCGDQRHKTTRHMTQQVCVLLALSKNAILSQVRKINGNVNG